MVEKQEQLDHIKSEELENFKEALEITEEIRKLQKRIVLNSKALAGPVLSGE